MPRILSGVRQVLVVLVRSVYPRAYGMVGEFDGANLIRFDCSVQPDVERVRRQDQRHALVNGGDRRRGGSREDRARQARFLSRLPPFRHEPGEAQQAAAAPVYIVWPL